MAIPILSYFIIVWNYSVNAPFWDDYDAALRNLIQFKNSDTFSEKLSLILVQHNEHRIILDRLIFHLQHFVFGGINFFHLIILGNLLLVALFILLIHLFKSNPSVKLLHFLPIPFILFQLQFHETSLWATTSIQNFGIILFCLLTLYYLDRTEKSRVNLLYAIIFSILAIITNTNGLLIVIVGAILLIEKGRQWKNLAVWLVVLLPIFGAYFINYRSNPNHPSVLSSLKNPLDVIEYLFYYLGGYFRFTTSSLGNKITLVFGFGLFLAFIYLVFSKKYTANRPLSYLLLFLFTTAGLTALARSGFGVYQAFSPRYVINPTVITVVLYYFLIIYTETKIKRYIVLSGVLILSIYLNVHSFKRIKNYIKDRKESLLMTEIMPIYPIASHGMQILKNADQEEIYKVPSEYLDNLTASPSECNKPSLSGDIYHQLQTIYMEEYLVFYESLAFDNNNYFNDSEIRVFLSNEMMGKTYCFEADKKYLDQAENINEKNVKSAGFNLIIQRDDLPVGTYKVGIQTISPLGQSAFTNTNKKIYNYSSKNLNPKQSRFWINKQENDSIVTLKGWAMKVKSSSLNFKVLVALRNIAGAEQVFSTQPVNRPWLTKRFLKDSTNYNHSAFKLRIPKSSLTYDLYDIHLLLLDENNNQILRIETKKKLRLL